MRDDMSTNETSDFCPYKGLQPYTEEDSRYFFGRNRDREIIAANLYAAPLTVLHGASGVGKSSVLMAGVVPRLKEEVMLTAVPRLSAAGQRPGLMADTRPQVKETARFPIVVFRNWQTGDFISALKEEALRAVVSILGEKKEDALRVIEQRLNQEQATLREIEERLADKSSAQPVADEKLAHNKRAVLNAFNTFKSFLQNEKGFDLKAIAFDDLLLNCRLVSGNPLFFIFDQFEEYFLYHPASNGNGSFDAELARAVNRQDVEANFLLSLREDGLSKLDRFQGRIPNLLGNMLRLEHLDRKSAKEAILNPLKKYNREAPLHPGPTEIEDALVEKLLDEVQAGKVSLDQTGQGQVTTQSQGSSLAARIETPFLQMVLMRLWDEEIRQNSRTLHLRTLNQLGGAERIVHTHLDGVMERLRQSSGAYPDIAARLFRFLVTPSGMKIAHTLNDLADLAELPKDQVTPVLEALIALRILRPVDPPLGQPSGTRYEIFHDVLAPAILDWRTRYVKDQKLIEAQRQAIEERQRADEQSKAARRLRWLVAILVLVTLVALGSTAYAYKMRKEAVRNLSDAQQARSDALIAQKAARDNRESAEFRGQIAIQAQERADAANKAAVAERERAEKERIRAEDERKRAEEQARIAVTATKESANERQIRSGMDEARNARRSGSLPGAIGKFQEVLTLFPAHDYLGMSNAFLELGDTYVELMGESGMEKVVAKEVDVEEDEATTSKSESQDESEERSEAIDGTLEKATAAYERARDLSEGYGRQSGKYSYQAAALVSLGSMYERAGRTADAAQAYETAVKLHKRMGNKDEAIAALESLGQLFEKAGNQERARGFYEQSLEFPLSTADQISRLDYLGHMFEKAGYKERAREFYERVLKLPLSTSDRISRLIHLDSLLPSPRDPYPSPYKLQLPNLYELRRSEARTDDEKVKAAAKEAETWDSIGS
ncbi:MAG TPA: tetratricopeptide repeat protein, partial [Pyrinomonadaceae bacterium]